MMSRRLLARVAGCAVLAASFVTSVANAAGPHYRLIHIVATDPSRTIEVGGLNDRGQVVGASSTASGDVRAFRWQGGVFTDLHNVIAPGSTATRANDINDRGTIIGDIDTSHAFTLRGTNVMPITVVPGEQGSDGRNINNAGQLLVSSFGEPESSGDYFVDGDSAELLPGVPGSIGGMTALNLNDSGAVVGHEFILNDQGIAFHAVLWQNGTLTELGQPDGFVNSFAESINNRNRIVGRLESTSSAAAAVWQDGAWTLLPPLAQGGTQTSDAAAINNRGMIVGSVTLNDQNFAQVATLWRGKRAVALDDLVIANDPLKPFVKLNSASWINDRGDIVALGTDSRQPQASSNVYFLQRIDDEG
jgi:probable HAF family extracellular repeat protein